MSHDIDELHPDRLRLKPTPLTGAERIARWRRRHGHRMITVSLNAETAASMLYLRKQWGFSTHQEMIVVALRYLATKTREGETT